ncbi:hypothetical protein [Hyphococcus sp.]|uniref:hypothetical protein n=1 Tax=Hyphococcus sp. TaxID=2038636 RepID=UPI002081CDCE|nr:MAG: hypothetical protein DHS20C04_13570 [Marinicaulis sp.]
MTATKPDEMSPDLASELAYVRALAEEGRDAPLVGGFYYLLWGALMGAAALMAFFMSSGAITLGPVNIYSVWITAGLIGWAASFLNSRRTGVKPGALTIGNRTAQAVWFSVGVFMTLLWIAIIFAHDNFTALGVPPYFLFSLMFPAAFGLYGVAFYASAVAARLDWLKWFALLSWGFSVISLFLSGSHYQFLAGALGSFVCAALPGMLLMREEPKEIV